MLYPASPGDDLPLRKMWFGGMGGVMAGLLTYPNDTVRRMLQIQGSRGTHTQFTGYWYVQTQILLYDRYCCIYCSIFMSNILHVSQGLCQTVVSTRRVFLDFTGALPLISFEWLPTRPFSFTRMNS